MIFIVRLCLFEDFFLPYLQNIFVPCSNFVMYNQNLYSMTNFACFFFLFLNVWTWLILSIFNWPVWYAMIRSIICLCSCVILFVYRVFLSSLFYSRFRHFKFGFWGTSSCTWYLKLLSCLWYEFRSCTLLYINETFSSSSLCFLRMSSAFFLFGN